MGCLFNTIRIENGRLVQFDEIINRIPNSTPEPTPEPIYVIPDNVIQFRFSNDTYDPSSLPGTWTRAVEVEGNTWNCELHDSSLEDKFRNKFSKPSETYVEIVGTGHMSGVTTAKNMFRACTALTKVGTIDFNETANIRGMFYGCTALQTVAPLHLDGSSVNAQELFTNCTSLTSLEIVSAPNVWTMASLAQNCSSLVSARVKCTAQCGSLNLAFCDCTSLITVELGDTSGASSLVSVFNGCINLVSVSDIDASRCEDANYMCFNCKKLKSLQISHTTRITDMDHMFYHCESMETISAIEGDSVTKTDYMFAHCYKLQHVADMNTPKLTNADQMFRECYSLVSLPFMNTSKVKSFSHFAHRCYSLERFPAYNTSSATAFNRIASCCPKLTTFPLLDTSKATAVDGMLTGHSSNYSTEYKMHIAELPAFDFSNVVNAENAFGNNDSLVHVPNYNMPKVTDVSNMYLDCPNVESGIYQAYVTYSSMATPPSSTTNFARNCGSATETGATELAQIPASWGGTGS